MSEVDEEAEKTKNQRPEGPPLRKVRLVELHDILTAHEKWLESEGKEGERADLSGANLQKAYLGEANLQEADLREANLFKANLQKADLREANLFKANLQKAYLFKANVQGAKLQGADLREATGFTASQVKLAKNWELAFYSDDSLKKLDLKPDHNERVKKKLAEMEKEKKATGEKP